MTNCKLLILTFINVKNVIAERSSTLSQSECSDRALRDDKAQPWTKSWTNAIMTMVFSKHDIILMLFLEFSLRVAKPSTGCLLKVSKSTTGCMSCDLKSANLGSTFSATVRPIFVRWPILYHSYLFHIRVTRFLEYTRSTSARPTENTTHRVYKLHVRIIQHRRLQLTGV